MEQPFLYIYRLLHRSKVLFWTIFISIIGFLLFGASRVTLEEDISRFFPDDKRVERLNFIFENSRLSDRLVMMVSVKDSATVAQPDSLVAFADSLAGSIRETLSPQIRKISARVDDSGTIGILNSVIDHLPVYMTEQDYVLLDSLSEKDKVRTVVLDNYRQLASPGGVVMKNIIVRDPLGFSFPVLRRLQHLQFDENFELYDNYILTRDHRHLLFFLEPIYPPNETRHNAQFQAQLNEIIAGQGKQHPELIASYFGGSVVAVGNAAQLQKDTILTVSIMLTLLIVALLGFFRKKRIPFLILVPVVIGALFALAVIAVVKGSLSILALAVGAVILGVAVDYSLHYLVHLKETRNSEEVIRQLAKPLTIGSFTTVFAFLCLQFTNAAVLQDIGLFAALSLIGAAASSLIFLPHLIGPETVPTGSPRWLSRLSETSFESKKWLVYIILLLTPLFLIFAWQVKFNSDMNKLNFMTDGTRVANHRLETINQSSLSSVYVVSSFPSLEKTLQESERTSKVLAEMKEQGIVGKFFSMSEFLPSDSLQQIRISRWNSFWTPERKKLYRTLLADAADHAGFSNVVVDNFDAMLERAYAPVLSDTTNVFRKNFFDNYIIEKQGVANVISVVNASTAQRRVVYQQLEKTSSTAVDKQMLTNLFVEYVHADFNYIVNVTSILVFLALLISYGRIELTLITFVPMLFTWIWILGLMGLFGIEFNIVNVMVSTFIFGLGDDYSIFIMDGLQSEYRSGRRTLPSIRVSSEPCPRSGYRYCFRHSPRSADLAFSFSRNILPCGPLLPSRSSE
jgi:uncharacterized protein